MVKKDKLMLLNFGCGRKIMEGFVNVDIQEHERIDKSFDFNNFPYPFKDNTFDYVLAKAILEHLDEPLKVLDELWRICKPNAMIDVVVPHWNCRSAYHVTHKNFWTIQGVDTIVNPGRHYFIKPKKKFELVSIRFKPTPIGRFVPTNRLRLFFSMFISGLITEIHFRLRVIK